MTFVSDPWKGKGKGTRDVLHPKGYYKGKETSKGKADGEGKGKGKLKADCKAKTKKASHNLPETGYSMCEQLLLRAGRASTEKGHFCLPLFQKGPETNVEIGCFEIDRDAVARLSGQDFTESSHTADFQLLRESRATFDVCCNRETVLGNPFVLPEDEEKELHRDRICEAYERYLDAVLEDRGSPRDAVPDPIIVAKTISADNGMLNISPEWEELVLNSGTDSVRKAVESLKELVASHAAAGLVVRLMCHCVPRRCHAMCLGKRVIPEIPISQPVVNTTTATQPRSVSEWLQQSDGPEVFRERPQWKGAGVVVFRETPQGTRTVCLVEKGSGALGFPKGKAEPEDRCPLDNARREWQEETNLELEPSLRLVRREPLIDSWFTLYFVATWNGRSLDHAEAAGHKLTDHGLGEEVWAVKDDPLDNDPILRAYWLTVEHAMQHPDLSQPRRELLERAMQVYTGNDT
eukprot:TRINITY_DN32239_c0_g1_i1.p1 TRINITY_DN32239_c0_g1~~TRINITY_DN32239_c0_g1_i1.p1  ORF type:complete len:463 (-),score=58.34 TRINITY_DN32239_c0_g1_i1:11-1399(-)